MAYELRFYGKVPRGTSASVVATRFETALTARYPSAAFGLYPPQSNICEFDVETPSGGYLYVFIDVDPNRVANAVVAARGAPSGLENVSLVATVVLSGAADEVLLSACCATF
jgi:hypothetical protein